MTEGRALREGRPRVEPWGDQGILGAFGCGAFRNPASQVARIYKEEIARRADDFSVIGFAIHAAGYGPDNFPPFKTAFENTA